MTLTPLQTLGIILAVAAGTQLTRWLPFWLFPEKKQPPAVVAYLGKVLPPAMMGLLVVYCLRSISWLPAPHGAPELIAIAGRKEASNEVRMTAIGLLREMECEQPMEMYISWLGSSPAATSTGKVLVSLTPNSTPRSAASLPSRWSMGTASENCRSSRKWWPSNTR